MKFPLPQGHKFGPQALALDVRFHPAKELAEQAALTQWQHHVMLYWLPSLRPNGFYDGPTQAAVIEVQRVSGINLTGWLDQDAWEATFKRGSNETPQETALESTESDENPEGVPQGTPENQDAQNGSDAVEAGPGVDSPERRFDPASPVTVAEMRRGPGRTTKK